MKVDLKTKVWRKAVVRAVSPWVESHGTTKVGDIILFPNDKGLTAGKCGYRDADGNIIQASSAIFLTEQKIFAKVSKTEA